MENELLSSTGNTPTSAFARFLPCQGDFLIFLHRKETVQPLPYSHRDCCITAQPNEPLPPPLGGTAFPHQPLNGTRWDRNIMSYFDHRCKSFPRRANWEKTKKRAIASYSRQFTSTVFRSRHKICRIWVSFVLATLVFLCATNVLHFCAVLI